MKAPADHQCHVLESPWPGVYGTRIESARHYGRHWHATFGLGVLEHGAQRSASGRGSVDAYAGDVITTNPGEVHDGRPLGGASRRWHMVYLEPGVVASLAGHTPRDVALTQPVLRDTGLRQALRRLFVRLDGWRQSPDGASALASEEALVEVCALLLERHATSAPRHEAGGDVARAREWLADNLLEAPTLADLATRVGMSRFQLLRRFQKAYGVPPHAWLLLRRAEHARGLIRDGATLAQAAVSSGFADQSHMTRVFVRQFGFTPGAWRKALQ
jgi:AraC-like DNA-binding protein